MRNQFFIAVFKTVLGCIYLHTSVTRDTAVCHQENIRDIRATNDVVKGLHVHIEKQKWTKN